MKEPEWIESYYDIGYKANQVAKKLGHFNQLIYNVVNFLRKAIPFLSTSNVIK